MNQVAKDSYNKAVKPTIWTRLGFVHCIATSVGDESHLHSTFIHVDWRDRIRLLFSGKCMVSLRVNASDAHHTTTKFSVLPPNANPVDKP